MEENIIQNNIETLPLPPSWEVACTEDLTAAIIMLTSTASALFFNDVMAKYGIMLKQEEIPDTDLDDLYDYSNRVFAAALGDILEKRQGEYFAGMMYYLALEKAGIPEGVVIAKPNLTEKNEKLVKALSDALEKSLSELIENFPEQITGDSATKEALNNG